MRATLLLPAMLLLALALPATASASTAQYTIFEAPREMLSDDANLRSETLDEIQGFGVRWMRVIMYWRDVAPDNNSPSVPNFNERDPNGPYNWGRYDRIISEARARGINIVLTVSGPVPRWATAARVNQVTRPSPTRYQRFMEAAARRYGNQIYFWSVWNEPNHPQFLRPQYTGSGKNRRPASPAIYRQLLFAANRGLRAGGLRNPRILAGETAPRGTSRVVAPLTFLRGTLCLTNSWRKRSSGCARAPMHGWAHHAYTTRSGPKFRPRQPNDVTIGVLGRLNTALARAEARGVARRTQGIYLTEFGVQSWPDRIMGVSQTQQAEFRSQAEQMAYRNGRVRAFSQYLMRDDDPREGVPASQRYSGFESGLRRNTGQKKRAYEGFRLPLVATRGSRRTVLWGLVRPHRGSSSTVSISFQVSGSSKWHFLKRVRTNSRGYFSTNTAPRTNRRYRISWLDSQGTRHTGPLTRSYAG